MREIFIFAVLFLLASCGRGRSIEDYSETAHTTQVGSAYYSQEESETSDETKIIISPELPAQEIYAEAPEIPALEEENPFAPILNAYAELERSGFTEFDREVIGGSWVAELNVNYTAQMFQLMEPSWFYHPNFLYALHDINGDGVLELFIGAEAGIAGIYALQNGKPTRIIQRDQHAHIDITICEFGRYIIHAWSARMGVSEARFYILCENAELLNLAAIMTQMHIWYCDDDWDTYHSYTVYSMRNVYGEEVEITRDEYLALHERYGTVPFREVTLDWHPILEVTS